MFKDLRLLITMLGSKVDVWLSLVIRHIMFLGHKKIFRTSLKWIHETEGSKDVFIAHFYGENYIYVELKLKEEKIGWKKVEPMERVYINYHPKNNLPTLEAPLHDQRYK